MFDWLKRATTWQPPQVSGEERDVHVFGPGDGPVSRCASWTGTELEVEAREAGSVALFDLELEDVERGRLMFRFTLQAQNLAHSVYPELWCRLPEKGLFFSRGIDRKVKGTIDGKALEIPFYLEAGQQADLVHLNLAFEGPGKVHLRNIRVTLASLA